MTKIIIFLVVCFFCTFFVFATTTNYQIAFIENIAVSPFWTNGWFYAFIIFIIAGVLVFHYILRTRFIKNQKQNFEKKINERTFEILAANKILKEHQHEIIGQNEEIKKQAEELFQQKQNLEKIIDERTKIIKENEINLQTLLDLANDKNNALLTIEEELRQNIDVLLSSQDAIREAKEQAEYASKAKTQFLANMSHEIRTPLNAIVGFTQILIKRAIKLDLPVSFKQQLENVRISGQNLTELINNILDLSKIEAGKMTLDIEPINFKQLFQTIYHVNKAKAAQKEINFSYDIASNIPSVIESDRTKMNQILLNLTSNAMKFTPSGKSIKITAEKSDEHLLIKVIDTGIGVAEDKKILIFRAFEQADNTITRHYGGTGLGLAITKKIVNLLKGEIWLESELGVGTTFFVKIPLVESQIHLLEDEDYDFTKVSFSKDNVILVAEDNEMNQTMIAELFNELGLEIHIANNGIEAIELTRELKPDLILMDMHMPEMDGMQATEKIREIDEFIDTPIVALSADAFTEHRLAAKTHGVSYYLAKPIDFKELILILEKHLKQNIVSENNRLIEKPLLTDDIKNSIDTEINNLLKIPTFNFKEIIRQISKLKYLYTGKENQNQIIFHKIEDAAYAGDYELLEKLFKEVVNEK